MMLLNLGPDGGFLVLMLVFILILAAPAIILTIIGLFMLKKNPKASKVLFIISGVYLLIGLGICGSMM